MIKISRYLRYVLRSPFLAVLLIALSLSLTMLVCGFLMIDKIIFDKLLATLDPYLMAKIACLFAGLAVFSLALRFALDACCAVLQARISAQLRLDLLRRILGFEYGYFLSRDSGAIVKRLVEDAETLAEGVLRLFLCCGQILQVAASILLFRRAGGDLILAYAALSGIYLVWGFAMKAPIERSSDRIGQGYGRLYDFFWEVLPGIREIKLQGLQGWARARLMGLQAGCFADIRRNALYNSMLWALVTPMSWGFFLFVMDRGLEKIRSGAISIGLFMILLGMLQVTLEPLHQLMRSLGSIHRAKSAAGRIASLCGEYHEGAGDLAFSGLGEGIRVEGMRMRYPSGHTALDGVDMVIRAGQAVAIVGGTGSGKSSFANVLIKLFQDYEGKVLLDGKNLKRYSTRSLRERVGFLAQETFLFPGTLRENIDPFRRLSDARIEEVCRSAQLADVLARLPAGLGTVIGPGGTDFSGGERQRISLARCLARNADLIILDEATSALDSLSEERVLGELRSLLPKKTIISITHKAAFARWADVIHVMERGRVVESGSHAELIERNGPYRRLFGGGCAISQSGPPD